MQTETGEEDPLYLIKLGQSRESILRETLQSNSFAEKSRKCGQYYIYKHQRLFLLWLNRHQPWEPHKHPTGVDWDEHKYTQAQTMKCWLESSLSPGKVLIHNFKTKCKQGCGTFRPSDTEIPGYKAWPPGVYKTHKLAGWALCERAPLWWTERKPIDVQEFNYRGEMHYTQVNLDWMDWTLER